jgi:hypothetical protein
MALWLYKRRRIILVPINNPKTTSTTMPENINVKVTKIPPL